ANEPRETQAAHESSVSVPEPDTWILAHQETQRQIAEVHTVFLNAMTQAHLGFLRSGEIQQESFLARLTGAPTEGIERRRALPTPPSAASSRPLRDPIAEGGDKNPVFAPTKSLDEVEPAEGGDPERPRFFGARGREPSRDDKTRGE